VREPGLWIAALLLLGIGAAGGWALGSSSDTSPAVSTELRPRGEVRLDSRLRRLEGALARARGGSQPPPRRTNPRPLGALSGVTIVVDPGHNGANGSHPEEIGRQVPAGANGTTKACNTTGTETDDGALTEAQFNFDVATDLRARLSSGGARVAMTRTDNEGVGPCVDERAEIVNRANADAAISIHADGNLSPGARGFDVIHPASDEMVAPALARPDRSLAVAVRDALVRAGVPPANYVGSEGLDERDDLAGLNLSTRPTVLVELGNMRSASEAAKLESPAYRAHLAEALAEGLRRFLGGD
jgi:N-acetylmuramoyl-L-alanine amidase